MPLVRITTSLILASALTACLPAPEPEPAPPEPVALGTAPTKYSTTKPYFNTSENPAAVRSSPNLSAPILATLAKGEGGMVTTCDATETRCQITFGEFGAVGWVNMATMALKG